MGVEVAALYGETEEEMTIAQSGDQIRLRLRGIEEEDIMPGFVLCSPKRPVHCVKAFEAQIRVLELKSILSLVSTAYYTSIPRLKKSHSLLSFPRFKRVRTAEARSHRLTQRGATASLQD